LDVFGQKTNKEIPGAGHVVMVDICIILVIHSDTTDVDISNFQINLIHQT
jgi:hypothetical protein